MLRLSRAIAESQVARKVSLAKAAAEREASQVPRPAIRVSLSHPIHGLRPSICIPALPPSHFISLLSAVHAVGFTPRQPCWSSDVCAPLSTPSPHTPIPPLSLHLCVGRHRPSLAPVDPCFSSESTPFPGAPPSPSCTTPCSRPLWWPPSSPTAPCWPWTTTVSEMAAPCAACCPPRMLRSRHSLLERWV